MKVAKAISRSGSRTARTTCCRRRCAAHCDVHRRGHSAATIVPSLHRGVIDCRVEAEIGVKSRAVDLVGQHSRRSENSYRSHAGCAGSGSACREVHGSPDGTVIGRRRHLHAVLLLRRRCGRQRIGMRSAPTVDEPCNQENCEQDLSRMSILQAELYHALILQLGLNAVAEPANPCGAPVLRGQLTYVSTFCELVKLYVGIYSHSSESAKKMNLACGPLKPGFGLSGAVRRHITLDAPP